MANCLYCIFGDLILLPNQVKIKSFIILTIRQSLQRVDRPHTRVIALRLHSLFRKNVAVVASRWQQRVRFDQPDV